MKLRLLPTLLLLSTLAFAALGGYIKYGVLEPLGIHREESIIAMPFVLHSDKGLQFMVEISREMMQQPTEKPQQTTVATEPIYLATEMQNAFRKVLHASSPASARAVISRKSFVPR